MERKNKNNQVSSLISWEDFQKVELRVGTVTHVEEFPEAHKPAYKITVDFGPEIGMKRSSAQVTQRYSREQLVGRQIIGVINFPTKQIGPFMSEFLITGFYTADGEVTLAIPDGSIPNGARLC